MWEIGGGFDSEVEWGVLFSQAQVQDVNGPFRGWPMKSDPFEWESRLPGLATQEFFRTDPAYADLFSLDGSVAVQELGRYSVFGAVRNCVTQISTAWGYFQSSVKFVKLLFQDDLALVSRVMDTLSTVMESIELAVNSIAWIPIVGWIIKIIFEVAKIITNIISSIQERRAERRQSELDKISREYALPMAEWTPEADTLMCQELQKRLMVGAFDLEWAFSPRYPAKKAGDFVAQHQKFNSDDECFSAWLVWSNRFKSQTSAKDFPGLGYVPGTMNLHGAVSLSTGGGGQVKDYGDFFPITRSTAAQIWQQAVKGDSGLTFAMDAEKLIEKWKDYAAAAYHYGLEAFGGWSMISGRINRNEPLKLEDIPGLKYNCSSCDSGNSNCDSKLAGKKEDKRWRTPPGHGHRNSFLSHIQQMMGWKTFQYGESLKEDDWWETMTPVQALRNLQERQEAMIRSPKCMYLDDSTDADGTGQVRFKAIRKGSNLHKIWEKSVTAMFESGDWKRIDYRDVIPGEEVDKAIRLVLQNQYKTTPEKFFNLDKKFGQGKASMGIAYKAGPSVLGDPEPPKPPGVVEVRTATVKGMALSPGRAGKGKKSGSRKKSSNAPLLIGAAAVGLLMMRGRK